jgi:membrane-bound lytic murein transglycosylase D
MPFLQKTSLRLTPLAVLVLAACATVEEKPDQSGGPDRYSQDGSSPPYYLRSELEDPFAVIDQAMREVGDERRRPLEVIADAAAPTDLWSRVIERFEFASCPEDSRADRWARWFADRPEYMERVLTRAHPWLHDIANELEARGLPGELALLPIVESAYDPFAYSHGRASGAWQFLSGTAREYGIEINEFYDGRRDVYAATRAALDYLTYLGNRFDDWNLALAAYNGGQGRVSRAIVRNRARNRPVEWHDLPLPRETLAYVPKMNGLGCLFGNPEHYGFELPVWIDQPGFALVELDSQVDIVVLSAMAGLELAELVGLNAGLNRHLTSPTGPHHLVVPVEQKERVLEVLPDLDASDMIVWREISVRRGDTLSGLAHRHDTSVRALRAANNLNGDMLSIGQKLRLPSAGMTPENSPHAARYQELANLQERLLPTRRFHHRVRPGESLWVIARNHRVSVADLQRWNGLGQNSMIRPGQRLLINSDRVAGTSSSSPAPVSYTVRNGDSAWLIARRHRVSLADLLRWNGLNESSVLRPGQKLTIRRGSDA